MDRDQYQTERDKRAGEWDDARVELQRLIDYPEKHLPVSEYTAHIRAAQKAVARAYKAMLAHG